MHWSVVLFFVVSCRVDGFVSVRRVETRATTEEEVLKRLANITSFAASGEKIKDVKSSGAGQMLADAFKAKLPANASAHKWDAEAWRKNVTNWALNARDRIHDRFLKKKKTAGNNATKETLVDIEPHNSNISKMARFIQRAKAQIQSPSGSNHEDILLLGAILDMIPITLTAIAPGTNWIKPVMVGIWYLVGTSMYMIEGDMDMLHATSMLMQMDSTIGWGSNCLTTSAGKLFTTLHMFLCGQFISPAVNAWVDQLFTVWDRWLFPDDDSMSTIPGRFFTDLFFLVSLAGGVAATYAYIDTTGSAKGTTDAWVDGVYFAMVTLSTVGYGDLSPTTPLTLGMSLIWAELGSRLMGHVMGLSDQYFKAERYRRFGKEAYETERIERTGKLWSKMSRDDDFAA